MNRERIQALLDGMRSVSKRVGNDEGVFDIDSWGGKDTFTCGFAGCLIGWAAYEQWLKPLGIDLTLRKKKLSLMEYVEPYLDGKHLGEHVGGTDYTLAKLFDVDPLVIQLLIYSENYSRDPNEDVTPDMVIERLEALVELGNNGFLDKYAEEIDRDWK
jgi:hypothetical protein